MVAIAFTLSAILAIIVGILILIWPKLLRFALGLYLVIFGILQLLSDNYGLSPFN
ncbi:MAG: DUF3096 domain-containing protein [Candidatus Pacearchaeota archaeon]